MEIVTTHLATPHQDGGFASNEYEGKGLEESASGSWEHAFGMAARVALHRN